MVFAFSLSALTATTGCNDLRARFTARDGVELYHRGKHAEAAQKFEEATKLDDAVPTIQLNLGTAYMAIYRDTGSKSAEGQDAARKAVGAYERYLQLKPKDERIKNSLVQTFVDTGRYDDAVAYFQPALAKSPPDPQVLNTLALVASKTGRFDEARKWYTRRVEADPSNADAHLALGVMIWDELHAHPEMASERRKELVDAALATLQKSIDLNTAAPNAYTYVNLVYREETVGPTSDDEKRVALQEANRYYQMALERQKRGN